MFLASWFIRKKNIIQEPKIIRYFIILNVFVGLIFVSIPDMGIALVMALTGLIMLWYAGAKLKYIVLMGLGGIFLSIMGVFLLSSITSKYDYLTARMTHFLRSDVDPSNRGI
jgi:cell division protein FtsW (lipid II flippase)